MTTAVCSPRFESAGWSITTDKRRYRILVVPEWYPSRKQTFAGAFVREQVRAFVRAGHEVSVLAQDHDPPLGGSLGTLKVTEESGALVVRFRARGPRPRQLATVVRALALQAGLDRIIEAGRRPELVHAHVFSAGLLAVPLARVLRAPLVVSEHYSGFARGALTAWDRILARRVFATADLVAPVSEDLRRRIEAMAPRGRFAVVPNLVDTELFRPEGAVVTFQRKEPARLLLVGGLTDVKGVPHALAALAQLRIPAVLEIVGDGPSRGDYESLARAYHIDDRVRWHGVLSETRVAELMRQADLYLLASEWENLPTVVLEALASGLPVVATRVGGVPEIIGDGDGLLVPPRDPQSMARMIGRALEQRWDREAIARRAADRYGPSAIIARWETIYSQLLDQRHACSRSRRGRTSAAAL